MSKEIDFHINELDSMKNYPKKIYYKGDTSLLSKRKISIVGSRRPNTYSSQITHKIASELSKRDIVIVSGAAIGVDAISHKAAMKNTIAVVANGLNIKYPAINKKLIENIEKEALILSTYEENEKARNYTFVHRNEIVVSLGKILIVTHADENSGSLTSVDYALSMGKKVYTIPHRLNESIGTQKLIAKGFIEPIYDLDNFLNSFGVETKKDDLTLYLETFPPYEEALLKYGVKIFEMEIEGKIEIHNGLIKPLF